MAKRLLCNILVDLLGTYVEGLSVENLKLGVWSGEVELSNLQLKSSGLDGLNLPISVIHGSLRRLKLKIPWTALESKPVRLVIDGVYLQAGPLDVSALDQEGLKKISLVAKQQALRSVEDAVMASVIAPTGLQEKTQKLTYFQQLGAKIVDNIEVVLTNVHIRYEDSTSVPGRVFSFGITIDSISLSTTNENWNEAFVARDFNSAATATAAAIHKLGTLRNLGIYCKADNQPFADMLPSDWQQAMHDMIYTHAWETEGPPDTDFEFDRSSYILSVPNNLKVKLIHTERCTEDVPKVDVNIEVSNLGLNLDKQQFQQLMATSQKFSLLDKQKQVALLRPAQRPDKDPRGWWQYALKLITGRDMSARDKILVMIKCVRLKKRYIQLVKRARAARNEASAIATGASPSATTSTAANASRSTAFGKSEEQEMLAIELELPLCALLIFRQTAAYEMLNDEKALNGGKVIMRSGAFVTSSPAIDSSGNGNGNGTVALASGESAHGLGRSNKPNEDTMPTKGAKSSALTSPEVAKAASSSGTFSSWFSWGSKAKDKEKDPDLDASRGSGSNAIAAAMNTTSLSEGSHHSSLVINAHDEEEDQKLITLIQSKFAEAAAGAAATSAALNQFILRLSVSSSATLRLTNEKLAVALLEVGLNASVNIRSNKVSATFSLESFHIIDECTVKPLNRYLVAPLSHWDGAALDSGKAATARRSQSQDGTPSQTLAIAPQSRSQSRGNTPSSLTPSFFRTVCSDTGDSTTPGSPQSSDALDAEQELTWKELDDKMLVEFESVGGKMYLKVTAQPMEITWNDVCIERILNIFQSSDAAFSPVDVQSSITSAIANTSLIATMNQFSADASALPISDDMEIILDIAAPKFIIPDNCREDKGCLLLDAGYLSVKGTVGKFGIKFGVSLSAVNVGLPKSVKDRSRLSETGFYVVRPFDITVNVHTVNQGMEQLAVTVGIHPNIQTQLDLPEISRLNGLVAVIIGTFSRASAPVPAPLAVKDTTTEAQNVSSSTTTTATATARRGSHSERMHRLPTFSDILGDREVVGSIVGSVQSRRRLEVSKQAPDLCLLDIQFTLSSVVMDCKLSEEHTISIHIGSVGAKIVQRPHDMSMAFSLGSFVLRDSLRHADQRAVIWSATSLHSVSSPLSSSKSERGDTSPLNATENKESCKSSTDLAAYSASAGASNSSSISSNSLVQITYVSMSSRRSPLYQSHGSELMVTFAKLGLTMNEEGLLRLKPLVEAMVTPPTSCSALTATSPAGFSEEPTSPRSDNENNASATSKATFASNSGDMIAAGLSALGPTGIKIDFTMGSISLTLLRSREKKVVEANASASAHNALVRTPSDEDATAAASRLLEEAFRIEINDFEATLYISKQTAVELRLRSFNVLDCRDESAGYAYRELITRSSIAAQHSSANSHLYSKGNSAPRNSEGINASSTAISSMNATNIASSADNMVPNEQAPTPTTTPTTLLASSKGKGVSLRDFKDNEDILSVIYKEETPGCRIVEVYLKDITAFVSIDAVMDGIEVTLSMVNALLNVTSVFTAGASGEGASPNTDEKVGTKTSHGRHHVGDDTDTDDNASDVSESEFVDAIDPDGPLPTTETLRKLSKQVSSRFYGALARNRANTTSTNTNTKRSAAATSPGFHGSASAKGRGAQSAASAAASTMNVVIAVINPRLLLLEDPQSPNSRAIIARCTANVHYLIDANDAETSETRENIDVTLSTLEIFALTGLIEGRPQQIVEPTGVVVHYKRRLVQNTPFAADVSVDLDSLLTKISVNDIALIHAIISRVGLAKSSGSASATASDKTNTDTPTEAVRATSGKDTRAQTANVSGYNGSSRNITMYDCHVRIAALNFTAINDLKGLNIPVVRLQLDAADFSANGALEMGEFTFDGSFVVATDYYNTRVATWEPMLEKWNPVIRGKSNSNKGTVVSLNTDHTVQFNLSGAMTKGLSHMFNIISAIVGVDPVASSGTESNVGTPRRGQPALHDASTANTKAKTTAVGGMEYAANDNAKTLASISGDEDAASMKDRDSPIRFENRLEFPIAIFNSVTSEFLLEVGPCSSAPLIIPGSQSRSWMQSMGKVPTLFDVKVLGRLEDTRKEISQLSINISKPRAYILEPIWSNDYTAAAAVDAKGKNATDAKCMIVEEAYENQRFDLTKWARPWTQMGDPPLWSDAAGRSRRELSTIQLPNDTWEWVEPDWMLDVSGVPGKLTDEDGWDYAINFPAFQSLKKKRPYQPLDVARRRRWFRTRVLKSFVRDETSRPLTVYWDVITREDGSKLATVRSGLEIVNLMPFPISIALLGVSNDETDASATGNDSPQRQAAVDTNSNNNSSSNGQKEDHLVIIDSIAVGSSFASPLMYSNAAFIKFRPANGIDFDWSAPIDCIGNISLDTSSPIARLTALKGGAALGLTDAASRALCGHPTHTLSLHCRDKESLGDITFSASLRQLYKSRFIVCMPHVTLQNLLPCDLKYSFANEDGRVDLGALLPGDVANLSMVDFQSPLKLFVEVEGFARTEGIPVVANERSHEETTKVIDFYKSDPGTPTDRAGKSSSSSSPTHSQAAAQASSLSSTAANGNGIGIGVSAVMSTVVNAFGSVQVTIYSRYAIVDKSGLDISIRTKRTCSTSNDSPSASMTIMGAKVAVDQKDRRQGKPGEAAHFVTFVERHTHTHAHAHAPTTPTNASSPPSAVSPSPLLPRLDDSAKHSWSRGANGVALFHSDNDKATIGVYQGSVWCWCENISLSSLAVSKRPFEILDPVNRRAYQLAYSTSPLPGLFQSTHVVTVVPSFTIVNCLDEELELRQVEDEVNTSSSVAAAVAKSNRNIMNSKTGSDGSSSAASSTAAASSWSAEAHSSKSWHKLEAGRGTLVQLRSGSSTWSLGAVDLNEIGTTTLVLPCQPPASSTSSTTSSVPLSSASAIKRRSRSFVVSEAAVVHVEVKFADPSENSYVKVVIWREKPNSQGHCFDAAFSVRNSTTLKVTMLQANINYRAAHSDLSAFEIAVPPFKWKPYGWTDQSSGSLVIVRLEGKLTSASDKRSKVDVSESYVVDFLKLGEMGRLKLPIVATFGSKGGRYDSVVLNVATEGSGRVLQVKKEFSDAARKSMLFGLNKYETSRGFLQDALQSEADIASDADDESDANSVAASEVGHPEGRAGAGEDGEVVDDHRDFILNVNFRSIGISVIAERPVRREFLSTYIEGIDVRLWQRVDNREFAGNVVTSLEVKVADMQVDNYSATAVKPVLLHSFATSKRELRKLSRRKRKSGPDQHLSFPDEVSQHSTYSMDVSQRGGGGGGGSAAGSGNSSHGTDVASEFPFILFSAIQELPKGSTTPIYKYVALRILEIKLAVDSSTLQLYYCDLHDDLLGESKEHHFAMTSPIQWIDDYNRQIIDEVQATTTSSTAITDIAKAKKEAMGAKMYFEQLIIHPMKLRISFAPTNFPQRPHNTSSLTPEEVRIFKIIHNIAAIDDLVIKISSFIVNNVMESAATLGNRVVLKITRDLQSHLVEMVGRVFGSLEVIGRPAGLYKNIGGGVQDFFYEPYEGMMESPAGFVTGLGKGTGSLFSGLAVGAITSTAAIVAGATKGVAAGVGVVSGDQEYLRQREEHRRRSNNSQVGLLTGMRAGGESVFSGFSAGITGLVMKPVKGGQKAGALGVVKGIGLGVAGVITKPVLGVVDGVASVAHGLSTQVADVIMIPHARPPRAFERSTADPTDLILVALNLSAARAQEIVVHESVRENVSDAFVAHVAVDGTRQGAFAADDETDILSTLSMTSGASAKSILESSDTTDPNSEAEKVAKRSTTTVGKVPAASVVVSEQSIWFFQREAKLSAKYSFKRISHCRYNGATNCVELVLAERSRADSMRMSVHHIQTSVASTMASSARDLASSTATAAAATASTAATATTPGTTHNAQTHTAASNAGGGSGGGSGSGSTSIGNIGNTNTVSIACPTAQVAQKLYSALVMCASQMANPSLVMPVDVAIQASRTNKN